MPSESVEQTLNRKPNLTLLQQQHRRKNKERPAGRKQPRKNDFDQGKLPVIIYM